MCVCVYDSLLPWVEELAKMVQGHIHTAIFFLLSVISAVSFSLSITMDFYAGRSGWLTEPSPTFCLLPPLKSHWNSYSSNHLCLLRHTSLVCSVPNNKLER